jgi:hypothetical protein
MIHTRIRNPAMEPITMPAIAPPERSLASSGSLLLESSVVVVGVVVPPVTTVTVAPGVVVVWRWKRRCGSVRVGCRFAAAAVSRSLRDGKGAMIFFGAWMVSGAVPFGVVGR